MSEQLVDRLCADLRPVSADTVPRQLAVGVAAGVLVSAVVMLAALGPRPDLPRAVATTMFWVKAVYALALAAIGLWAADRAARPAGVAGPRLAWLAAPLAAVLAAAVVQLAGAPAPMRGTLVLGESAIVCPWLILLLSLAPFAGLAWAMRRLAPTRLRLAGTVAGLAAGGIGAVVYCVHCTETGAPFLALWFTLGVVLAGLLGALLGPWALRWR